MEQLVTSEFKLGIIAGGQLGKMLVLAASKWDVQTYILDPDEHCPASSSCTQFIQGDYRNYDDVIRFGKMVDMIVLEIENVNVEALKYLKSRGKQVFPDPDTLEMIQDKGKQKHFYAQNGIPTPEFKLYEHKEEIKAAIHSGVLKFPFVQKLRKGGYDGRGVAIIQSMYDLSKLLEGPSVIEDLVKVEKEIAVIVARNGHGEVQCYPMVEMEFNETANLVERLICPAAADPDVQDKAMDIARKIVNKINFRGILAVEMFIDREGNVQVNEMAPRPHNSGHHTIESVITSQYEQLLRAIFNFPLGSTRIKMPAVMINLLGEAGYEGAVRYEGLTESMRIEGVNIHLYGKKHTKPFRKMGHVTVLDSSIESARKKAEFVKQNLKITSWQDQLLAS